MSTSHADLLKSFRNAVMAKIRRDLVNEDRHAESLRNALLPRLRRVIEDERARGACGRAWLFGSFAWDKPNDRSDVDVMVEGCAEPFRLATAIAKACDREAQVIELELAPVSLRERVLSQGRAL